MTRKRNETANDDNYDTDLTATRTSSFTYYTSGDTKGLLKTEVREPGNTALKHTTTYDYDKFGNRVKAKVQAASGSAANSSTETRCDHNTLEHDTYGRFVVAEKDCLNRTRRMGPYNKHGLPAWSEQVLNTDGTGAVRTEYSYTPGGRLYFSHGADGSYTGTAWQSCGAGCPAEATYYIETRQAGGGVSREYRDALDRVVRTETRGFAQNTWSTADTEYDNLGRVARQSEPYYRGADRHWTGYDYDLLGRVTRTTLPDYVSGSVNSVITVSYAGRVATTTNGKGQRQVQTRNALGEVIKTADHLGTTVTHSYDAWGQVISTTTSGTGASAVTVSMSYDARGRRTGLTDPDRGTWAYAWNGFDELVEQTDAVGNVQKMTYDALGRLETRKDYLPGATTASATATWTYDPANGLGQLHTVTDDTYTRTHGYDALGRPATVTHALGGSDGTYYSRQTYDEYGRVHQVFDAARTGNTPMDWQDNVVEVQYNGQGYAHKWVDASEGRGRTILSLCFRSVYMPVLPVIFP